MTNEELDERCESLFDLVLEFDKRFAAHAIDIAELSDEDAEREAVNMTKDGRNDCIGLVFATLLRRVKHERNLRAVSHMVSAVWAVNGTPEGGMGYPEIRAEYEKLQKGEA